MNRRAFLQSSGAALGLLLRGESDARSAAAPTRSSGRPLASGRRIPVGGNGRGALSAGLTTFPLGAAFIHRSARPDLFLVSGRFGHEPGLYLYRWIAMDVSGAPVFGDRTRIGYPGDPKLPPPGVIFTGRDGAVRGFWIVGDTLVRTRFDPAGMEFRPVAGPLPFRRPADAVARDDADGRPVDRVAVFENADGGADLIFSVSDRTAYYPAWEGDRRNPSYRPFDGAGIWRGGLPRVFLCTARLPGLDADLGGPLELRPLSAPRGGALISHGNLAAANLGSGHERELLSGSHYGNFHHWRNPFGDGPEGRSDLVRGPGGAVLRHPTIWNTPVSYPGGADGACDLIAGGEGCLYHYAFAGFDGGGRPVYGPPAPVLEEEAALYGGSLPVVSAIDWDGDGVTDLVLGNSEGRVLFFRNAGTDERPDFEPPARLSAGGAEIHVQQGYMALQGPDEAAWGYLAPVAADWDGDGRPDILAGDATARYKVYLNHGLKTAPLLAAAGPLYCDGLDVHGTWRSRPGVARWGGGMAFVALDDADELHLYWRIDDHNVSDGGKLRMVDGSAIRANYLPAGGEGRARIELFDWDGDGVIDLLVGTPRHGSLPNPKTGLPQSKGRPGAAVLWLRNVGTNEAPAFAWPKILCFRGRPVYFGQHECSVSATLLGGGGPNLVVGDEEGRIWFYRREDISWTE